MRTKPIPGQSLTDTPKNAPWERPPAITDPEEAVLVHIEHLSDPEKMESIMEAVSLGLDIQTITKGITRSAVQNGIHSIDVSLIVQPVVHEMIKQAAETLDIEYDEGFENKKQEAKHKELIIQERVKKKLRDSKGVVQEKVSPVVEESIVETPVEEAPVKPRGLMERSA